MKLRKLKTVIQFDADWYDITFNTSYDTHVRLSYNLDNQSSQKYIFAYTDCEGNYFNSSFPDNFEKFKENMKMTLEKT